jgi:iron uptake system component EfeO
LWEGDIAKSAPVANKLVEDIKRLAVEIDKVNIKPLDLANGAKELLDEVATSKVTGEEDRYSHTDLWDFSANVEGSQTAVASLRPVIDERDPALGKLLDEKFAAVEAELAKYRSGEGFKFYTELSKDQIRTLADAINGLGEPVSKVAAVVTKK